MRTPYARVRFAPVFADPCSAPRALTAGACPRDALCGRPLRRADVGLRQRQRELERAALAEPRATRLDAAAVQAHEVAHQREPEAEAAMLSAA